MLPWVMWYRMPRTRSCWSTSRPDPGTKWGDAAMVTTWWQESVSAVPGRGVRATSWVCKKAKAWRSGAVPPGVARVAQVQQRGFPGLAGHRDVHLDATAMKQIPNYRTYAFIPEASPSGAKYP